MVGKAERLKAEKLKTEFLQEETERTERDFFFVHFLCSLCYLL